MTETIKKDITLKFYSPFNRTSYIVTLTHMPEGWIGRFYGQNIVSESDAYRLLRVLDSQGTKFPEGLGGDFVHAWAAIRDGKSYEDVENDLQRAVDRPTFNQPKRG